MMPTSAMLSFLLLFVFATTSFPRAVDAQGYIPAAVTDVSGNDVITGEEYYIYSPPFVGIGLEGRDVMLREFRNVLPIIITSVSSDDDVVRLHRNYNFKFNITSSEDKSTTWRVGLSPLPRAFVVQIGGDDSYLFQIAKFENPPGGENWYRLRYCPVLNGEIKCQDVGAQQALVGTNFYLTPDGGFQFPIVFRRVNQPNNVNPYISSVV